MKWILPILMSLLLFQCSKPTPTTEILRLNREMEKGVKNANPLAIAAIYSDDGYVINPSRIEAEGRESLNAYWQNLGELSTDWKLENFIITNDLEDITTNSIWKELKQKPRLPTELNIEIPKGEDVVYQLGRSHLTMPIDGKSSVSKVDFLIVWKKVGDTYKIWIDTYA